MSEQLKRIPIKDALSQRSFSPRKYFSSATHGALTFIALVSRLIICPGDDILVATTAATLGFKTSDTLREAVLPKPTEIILEEENKNKDKNKV